MRQVFAAMMLMLTGGPGVASAQIVVNQQALQQLAGKPAVKHPVVRRPVVRHPYVRHPYIRRPVVMRPLPLPPPVPPSVTPVIAAVPPPKPVGPRAVTLLFPAPGAGLQTPTAQALARFIGPKLNTAAHFVIQAMAPGAKGDPSVARRMALDRGLAVRAALRRAGVASDHIIVQALGDPPHSAPNHVTLTELP